MSGNDRSSWDPEAQNKQVSARPKGRNFLLLIGIDTYDHFPKLENARRDTEAFRDILQRKYQFEPDHTIELFDDQATRRNILRALDGLTEQLTSDDNLLIYYAGHGYHRKRLNIGYFVPSEAETGAFEMLISNTTIRDYVRAFDAHHILLIVDSCFSGSLLHRDAEMVNAFAEKVDQFSSRWGLAAGMIEKVADGTVGSHSPFAKSLLHYLEQNTASRLPVSELIQYVSKITTYNADQTPIGGVLEQTEHLGGQFVFDLKVDEKRDWTEAQAVDSIAVYQAYLLTWPEGQHIETAHWRIACLTDTAIAYDLYLDRYPQGKWAKDADGKLREAEQRTDWKKAQIRDSLSAYRDFLRRHPIGKYADQARLRQSELRKRDEEPAAWKRAQHLDTQAAYETYLRNFPNGAHAEDARSAIAAMEAERKREEKKQAEKQRLAEAEAKRVAAKQAEADKRKREAAERKKQEEAAAQKAEEQETDRKRELELLTKEAKAAFQEQRYEEANDWIQRAFTTALPSERSKLQYLKQRVSSEQKFEQLYADAENAFDKNDLQLALSKAREAKTYPSRYESKALDLEARCKAAMPSPWQRNLQNPPKSLLYAGLVVIVLLFGGVGISKWAGSGDTEMPSKAQSVLASELDYPTKLPADFPLSKMIPIKGGTFQMGSNEGGDDEKPIHSVTISDFELGETEVTFEQFDAYCEATGKVKPDDEGWGRGNRPVINVSWQDAQAYCQWLSEQTGRTWRLPTEAEWEYAARGGQVATDTKYAGSNDLEEVAWYGKNRTHPVATKQPNELGLYDMSGNVYEWVEDQWHANYEGAPTDGTAWMDGKKGSTRVIRGGYWLNSARGCRVSYRLSYSPEGRNSTVGFRLVVSSQ